MTLQESQQQFIESLRAKKRSESTIVAYSKDIDQLLVFMSKQGLPKECKELTTEVLTNYVDELKKEGSYTLKTISRKINSLKTFSKFLLGENLIVVDVAEPIAHPEYTSQPQRILSPLEYRALRDCARTNLRLFTMVELLLQTGIRIGELSRLKKSDLNLEKGELRIEAFSSNRERIVELNSLAIEALRTFTDTDNTFKNQKDDYLFKTKTGRPVLIRNIRTAINRAFKKAGIKNATVNDIRNTFIVYQLEQGIRTDRLAELVGHQKPSTTEKYLDLVAQRPTKTHTKIDPL